MFKLNFKNKQKLIFISKVLILTLAIMKNQIIKLLTMIGRIFY